MNFILAQIFGVIALVATSIGYFCTRKTFLITQIICDLFYAAAFLVLNAVVAGILTIISAIRVIYLFWAESTNFKYRVHLLPLFVVASLIVAILFWQGWADIVPVISLTIFTFALALKNLQIMRYVLLIPNFVLMIYNIAITTYASAVLDLLEFLVIIVAIITFSKKSKQTLNKPN